ncbi:hypothetical protein MNV_840004 [Candidatus Methanoperedens nitroreducens]|uniref:Uncharacterized protein n=1 Tax=Candidatus Methanoperedens nitratireducens TaxID=1392998 RepID=A0A284VU51_9EURY|nr:hypothetical protein MNV_840004 [Candidatus Methanoperedens nitroreducens]
MWFYISTAVAELCRKICYISVFFPERVNKPISHPVKYIEILPVSKPKM